MVKSMSISPNRNIEIAVMRRLLNRYGRGSSADCLCDLPYPATDRQNDELVWLPIVRRQFERRKIKSRRDGTSDQCPVSRALGGLPNIRRHNPLRLLARRDIWAKPKTPLPVVVRDLQRQRSSGII